MTIPTGKGIFIWVISACGFGDDMEALADWLQASGFSFVTIKGLQSKWVYANNAALLPALVVALKTRGIHARIYQYVVGGSDANAKLEAEAAIDYCNALGVDGLDIDAEAEYNQLATKAAAKGWAEAYMDGLFDLPDNVYLSLCSYRYPSLQPYFPWYEFLDHPRLDFVMPQVYWQGAQLPASAGSQLVKSYDEYQALAPDLPFVPVGSAYCEHGWCSKPEQVQVFSDKAKELDLPGITFWSLQHLPTIAGMKDTVVALDWPTNTIPPDPEPTPEPGEFPFMGIVSASVLNVRSTPKVSLWNKVGKLYAGDPVEVYAQQSGADYVWLLVRDADNLVGWAASDWISEVE